MENVKNSPVVSASAARLTEGSPLVLCANMAMHHKHLVMTADIEGSLTGIVRLGHGKTEYASTYVEVDEKFVKVWHYYEKLRDPYVFEHGLEITGFLTVNIDVEYTEASVTVYTATGYKKQENISWAGRNGSVYVECEGMELSGVKASWSCDDYAAAIWLIGDSYFNTGYPARWPYYLRKDGYMNNFMTGFPGMGTEAALAEFKNSLKFGTPEFAVWCMGMNNRENGGVHNEGWLRSTEEFLALCRELGITPILATIPSTPIIVNDLKNAYVRSSGYRYIDFARAVGSYKDVHWYPEMLYTDNVHPADLGAMALYQQVLVDFPEIMDRRVTAREAERPRPVTIDF